MKRFKGSVILEVLIAMMICTVALLALVQISTKSINNSGYSKRQAVATSYAREGMEWIRGRIQLDGWSALYAKGSGGGSTYGINTIPNNLYSLAVSCGGSLGGTEFYRCVKITNSTQNPVSGGNPVQVSTVEVTVYWEEGTRTASVVQETVFTNN